MSSSGNDPLWSFNGVHDVVAPAALYWTVRTSHMA